MQHKQVFQTDSPTRWRSFVWTMRIVAFLLLLGVFSVCVALFKNSSPHMPRLTDRLELNNHLEQPHEIKKAAKRKKHNQMVRKGPLQSQIRAGFYVNWDLQSYFSLKNNIGKMNMVLPEWLFVDPHADTIVTDIDPKAFALMDSSQAKIVPLLSNNYRSVWNDTCVDRIVSSPAKRTAFIKSLIGILKKNGFDGVSVDFEDLNVLKNDQDLVEFHHELYDSLHANHLLATQCIPPFNEDYRISDLHKFNDYIFVMAYDEHFPTTKPGPVSDSKWVEQVLDDFTSTIEPNKFVLCIAGYGYDWLKNDNGTRFGQGVDVTYQEALTIAKESDGKIIFDNNGYNLHYNYSDEDDRPHEVWFTDAASSYNIMRTASNYGLAGVALWRLGSEDSRIWSFYKRDLSTDSLQVTPTDTTKFETVKPSTDIDYIGEGEVLDILSKPEPGKINIEYNTKDMLISEEHYIDLPSSYVVKKFGKVAPEDKLVLLTFDDGPDPKYTPQILDILKKENVPASFFLIGENIESNIPLVKRMYEEGYEIGNHTFTHPNLAEVPIERARLEMNATRRLIEFITGHSTVLFRPPYNADAEPQDMAEIIPVEESKKENYITIGESIDPQDWDVTGQKHPPINADSIFNRVVRQQNLGSTILLHDAGGDRTATVEALPRIIHYFKDRGYHFITIAQLLKRNKADLMPAVTKTGDKVLNHANFFIADGIFMLQRFIYGLFFVGIFLSIGRMFLMGVLASIQASITKRGKKKFSGKPLVSIIVPAHNEKVNAVRTVNNLLRSDYPNFEVIFVDDGSSDNTHTLVKEAFEGDDRVKVVAKPNGGKASALNYGIALANGEFIVCIDADTQLKSDAVCRLVEKFNDEDIGAVAGNVKVGNEVNMLTRWQSIEYITAQNFDRKAFDILNCITVVPGAIGAFRKSAIADAGGYTSDTLAEDCDLTIRILRAGYRITTSNDAISLTEAPENLSQFLRQRFRWCFGVMQTFWKHRDAFFRTEYGALGMVALPNILIFQVVLPMFSPLADLLMLVSVFSGNGQEIAFYYLIFQLVDLAGAVLAFSFERENIARLWMLIPQRFIYRWLMYYVLFKALSRALKGELQHWGVLKRTGNVIAAQS